MDLFATSAALRDVAYWNQLDDFFSYGSYKYEYIFVQVGNHSRINERGDGPFTQYDYDRFHDDYATLVRYLRQYSDKIILEPSYSIVIPPAKERRLKRIVKRYIHNYFHVCFTQQLDTAANDVAMRKNKVMEQVAGELSVPWCDINSWLDTTRYMRVDHIHYEDAASVPICGYLMDFARKAYGK